MGSAAPTWDPGQYLRFAEQRERPFDELVARIAVASPRRVLDLGCGPGTATARLRQRWPAAAVLGVDNSPEMVGKAAAVADPPQLAFALGDLRQWEPEEAPDVIVANAVLQWVPGHLELLGRWAGYLAPGGALAVQVPANFDQPTHTLLRSLAASEPWAADLHGVLRTDPVADPDAYLSSFLHLQLEPDVWETTYRHVLDGPDAILEWVRGTALRPVLSVLEPPAAAAFEAAYREALARAYPVDPAGRTVLAFRRIFAVGHRPR